MTEESPIEGTAPTRTPGERLKRGLGIVALVSVASVVTLAVDHAVHDHGDDHQEGEAEGHGDHEGHGEEGEGHEGHGEEGKGHEGHGEENHDGRMDRVQLAEEQLTEAGIELAEVEPGTVVQTVELPGELVLNSEAMAHVGPRVSGTVRSIAKTLGDVVKKGDVLAELDSADVAEMQGEVQAARERRTLAKTEYDRKKELYDQQITSQKEFLQAKQAYAQAKVELRSAQRALAARAGGTASHGGYALVAPLAGTIVDWHIGVGEVLEEDARAFTIADLSSVWVNVTVYAKDVPKLALGQRAEVRAEGIAEPIEGRISFVSPTVNELTRSATARIVLDEPGPAWRPGLFVTAEVEVAEDKAEVVVPEAALQRLEGKHVVFAREGKALEARPVVLGRHGHHGDRRVVEITQGLAAGTTIVTKNSFLIKAELGKATAGHEH